MDKTELKRRIKELLPSKFFKVYFSPDGLVVFINGKCSMVGGVKALVHCVEKMKKALNLAKKNKLLSEEVKTLSQISKANELIDNMFDVMNNPENIEMINQYIRQKLESGQDVAKAYKEIGLMAKAMIDAREGMISKMKTNRTGKNMKIAIKFTNDSGEDFQLGADIDG